MINDKDDYDKDDVISVRVNLEAATRRVLQNRCS